MSPMGAKLSPTEKEALLRDLWVAHDGQWFLKTAGEYGFGIANKMNMIVVKSMGRKEAKELMDRTGSRIASVDDAVQFLRMGSDLYWPEEHEAEIEAMADGTVVGRILHCFVWANVNRGGGVKYYQCAAPTRFEGWVEAMGVPAEVKGSGECATCNGSCVISFRFGGPASKAGDGNSQRN